MGIPNRISAVFSQEDSDAFKTGMDALVAKLPLVDLTEKERDSLNHLKEKNRGLVMSSLQLVKRISGFLPKDFDVTEFEKDANLFDQLFSVRQVVAGLLQRIDDTTNLAGNEAYAAALAVYNYAKLAGVGTEGIDPYLDEMARRFARKSKATVQPQPAK